MPKVTPFPNASLHDIPAQLRRLAEEIEAGSVSAADAIIVMRDEEGDVRLRTWGKGMDSEVPVVGLLQTAAILTATKRYG